MRPPRSIFSSPWRTFSFALAILTVGGCGEEAVQGAASSPPPPVRVETAASVVLTPTAEAVTDIKANRQAKLQSAAAGRVIAVSFEKGQTVTEGDVLLRLDVGRTASALDAAQAGIAQAEARLGQVQRERALAVQLVESGGAAARVVEDAADAERLALAAVDAARAQAQLTRRGLTEAVLRAPFSGTITEKQVEVGEFMAPSMPVALLADTSSLKATVPLDPRDALDLPVGTRATVRADARPDEVFQARVERIGEVVDPRTRRVPVELRIEDPDHRLMPGLVARFRVETGEPRQAITVDAAAVFERFGSQHVFVVRDGAAQRVPVEVGLITEGRAEIRSGIEAGDVVIIAGLDRVVHEGEVRIVESGATDPQAQADPGPDVRGD